MRPVLLIGPLALAALHCVNARAGTARVENPAGMDVLDFGETPEQAARRNALPGVPAAVSRKTTPAAPEGLGYAPEDVLNARGMAPVAAAAPPPGSRDVTLDRLGGPDQKPSKDKGHGHH